MLFRAFSDKLFSAAIAAASLPLKVRRVQIGVLYICPPQHIVRVNGKNVQLTNKEFEILCLLVENRGIVLTRGTLMDKVWGFDCDRENRTLDVHIRTLRVKLGEAGSCIETVRGVGYKIGGRA